MAVKSGLVLTHKSENYKRTSIGRGKAKTSSMSKTRKRAYKKYRGQG